MAVPYLPPTLGFGGHVNTRYSGAMIFTLCSRCGGAAKWNGECYVSGAYNRRFRPKIFRPLVLKEPESGYEEKAGSPGFWCFLFGPLYLAYRGFWTHAAVLFVTVLAASFFSALSELPAIASGQLDAVGLIPFFAGLFAVAALFLQWIYFPLQMRRLLRKRHLAEGNWREVTSEYIPEEAVI